VSTLATLLFVVGGVGFILGLKLLSRPKTARRGNVISACGMAAAVIGACLAVAAGGGSGGETPEGTEAGSAILWTLGGLIVGAIIGAPAARLVRMTAMPEMVGLFNGFGGLASALIAWSEAHRFAFAMEGSPDSFSAATLALAALIGGVTFTGSLVAFGKLSEKIPSGSIKLPGHHWVNLGALVAAVVLGIVYTIFPGQYWLFVLVLAVAVFYLGAGLVLPIGGADMPVVISLLNSYSGLAVAAAGFAIDRPLLIVTGSLVGAAGMILTRIMCLAMNRSLTNVLFGGFATETPGAASAEPAEANIASPHEAYYRLEAARSVIFVPGYGMAVAQAQHAVKELADLLEENGTEVGYAIHPVAGRMPGHMSVLLAEASVPYEELVDMDDINARMDQIDAAIVIGANDTVNPDARDNPESALAGMPIIEVDRAQSVFVLKRSLGAGYAGVSNPLFFKTNTSMVLGDAKQTLNALIDAFKEEA